MQVDALQGSVLITLCFLALFFVSCVGRGHERDWLKNTLVWGTTSARIPERLLLALPEGVYEVNHPANLELKRLSSVSSDLTSIERIFDCRACVAVRCEQLFPKPNRADMSSVYPQNCLVQNYLKFCGVLYSEVDRKNFRAVLGKKVVRFPFLSINPLLHSYFLKLNTRLRSSGSFLSSVGVPYDGIGLLSDDAKSPKGGEQANSGCDNQSPIRDGFWPESLSQVIFCLLIGGLLVLCGCEITYRRDGFRWGVLACILIIVGLGLLNLTLIACHENGKQDSNSGCSHNGVIVPHKYFLTSTNYWGTVIPIGRANMPNVLSTDKQVAVISALAEGSGIRQIERITGVHRDTIMRLGVRVGKGCANVLDRKMRNLSRNHVAVLQIPPVVSPLPCGTRRNRTGV